jgi:hypothetical protein
MIGKRTAFNSDLDAEDAQRFPWSSVASVIARSEATKQSRPCLLPWIASRSLSSGAHSRDLLARNDGAGDADFT